MGAGGSLAIALFGGCLAETGACTCIINIIDHFSIPLFSTLQQTHCASHFFCAHWIILRFLCMLGYFVCFFCACWVILCFLCMLSILCFLCMLDYFVFSVHAGVFCVFCACWSILCFPCTMDYFVFLSATKL